KYVPYIPKMLYAPLKAKDITWGDKDLIAKLYSDGKTESEIISLTKNRRAYVHNVILRLQHPEDFIIEKPKVKPSPVIVPESAIEPAMPVFNHFCKLCKKGFKASPCQKRVYCGRDCYNTDKIQKGQAEKIEQAPAKQKVSSLVTLYCKLCSKEFTASKWAERIYCSKPCYFADPNR